MMPGTNTYKHKQWGHKQWGPLIGKDKLARHARYRALFDDEMPSITVGEIKTATDKM
ncbi:hypothetical protein [Pseudoalteromonas byunsanensis]|uniref:hypothetical protein n=1 Tax=Pseudoalteromonas byunsanensis TaxID=327939 RepID=UPI001586D45F|nr:hypothetical protein [Pseudoalteromonas byunsanensis]